MSPSNSTRKIAYIFLFLAVFLSGSVSANPKIDALFSAFDKPGVPGASVGVFQNGQVTYQKAYGMARPKDGTKATIETNYRLASVSKHFTATAVLLLIERGKLSLDTTLAEIFPDFPTYGKKITVRMLLNHTGGMRDYEDLIPSNQSTQLKDHDILKILKKQSSGYFLPGANYRYSNGGYVVLGLIVESVSKMSFAQFCDENLFGPLGMKDTVFYEKGISTVTNRAYGHTSMGVGFVESDQDVTSATLGDGGVYTSVQEWLLWENSIRLNKLLSKEMQALVFTPGTLNSGSKTSYGFGWMLDNYKGFKRHHHTGSTIGFRTAIQRYPEKDLAILVLVNRANSSPWKIAEDIADLFLTK